MRAVRVLLVCTLLFAELNPRPTAACNIDDAVAYTLAVQAAYASAVAALATAAGSLATAKIAYEQAQLTLSNAVGAEATAEAAAALVRYTAIFNAAMVTYEAAEAAVAVTGAAAAGFMSGTGLYQLAAAILSCWSNCTGSMANQEYPADAHASSITDDQCNVQDTVFVRSSSSARAESYLFRPATDAEVERVLPAVMARLTGTAYTAGEYPGSARIAWDHAKLATKLYINIARGLATISANDLSAATAAGQTIESELASIPQALLAGADFMDTLRVMPASVPLGDGSVGAVTTALQQAIDAADAVRAAAELPPSASDPCLPENGGPGCDNSGIIAACAAVKNALQNGVDEIAQGALLDANGAPKSLTEMMRPMTHGEYDAFIQAVRDGGVAALPPWEVYAADTLFKVAGVALPNRASLGPKMAQYATGGDGQEGVALFAGSQTIGLSDMYRLSVAAFAGNRGWLDYNVWQAPIFAPLLDVGDVPGEHRFAIKSVEPNPVRKSSTLSMTLELPTRSDVTLVIHDVAGRQVQREHVGVLGAGSHRVGVTMRDRLGTGVFFVGVETGGERKGSARVVVVGN